MLSSPVDNKDQRRVLVKHGALHSKLWPDELRGLGLQQIMMPPPDQVIWLML